MTIPAEDLAMKLYDYQVAPNPRRVRIFLAEKGITVPAVQIDLRAGEQFTSYRRILVTAKGFRRRRFGSERMPD
jgi:hypothetical protein